MNPQDRLLQALLARKASGPAKQPMARPDAALDMAQGSQHIPMRPDQAARGVPGDQHGAQYEAHPNAQAAQARLQQLQAMGREGMAQPIGANGMHGLVHWPMQ